MANDERKIMLRGGRFDGQLRRHPGEAVTITGYTIPGDWGAYVPTEEIFEAAGEIYEVWNWDETAGSPVFVDRDFTSEI